MCTVKICLVCSIPKGKKNTIWKVAFADSFVFAQRASRKSTCLDPTLLRKSPSRLLKVQMKYFLLIASNQMRMLIFILDFPIMLLWYVFLNPGGNCENIRSRISSDVPQEFYNSEFDEEENAIRRVIWCINNSWTVFFKCRRSVFFALCINIVRIRINYILVSASFDMLLAPLKEKKKFKLIKSNFSHVLM